MKKFLAECLALPMLEDLDGESPDDDYTIGKIYVFTVGNDVYTHDDEGVRHSMDTDYFSRFFKRIVTDKDGYYV
jgi:hypothetical protein